MNWKILGLAAMLAAPAAGADLAGPLRITSAELAKMVGTATDGRAGGSLPLGTDGPTVVVLRRTQDGEVEVHDAFHDIFVVRAGRATVMVGGTVEGQRQTTPGEWRGGTIKGATGFDVAPGDLLWIPAGQPHQVILKGSDFTYVAVKSPKAH